MICRGKLWNLTKCCTKFAEFFVESLVPNYVMMILSITIVIVVVDGADGIVVVIY